MSDVAREGRVVATYGSHALVEDAGGERLECSFKGKRLKPVCGDRVRFTAREDGRGVIARILPRRSLMARHDKRVGQQALAANLDLLLVVAAPEPAPDPDILDRYLAAAEALELDAAIIFNKADLLADGAPDWMREYPALGYPLLTLSAETGEGAADLSELIRGRTGALVGQSGVGKSTLLNRLLGETVARTSEVSDRSREGRHTTTTAILYALPGGGELIDSPGVRDFKLWPLSPGEVGNLYREIREAALQCRFNDCTHRSEPGCVVREALEDGRISTRRYRSYRKLFNMMQQLAERARLR
jgi:ribosome biogenesis GTPase / thiamine phosphate phosphatase